MAQVREIRRGQEIGKTGGRKYQLRECPICGKERWVELRKGKPRSIYCRICTTKTFCHPNPKLRHKDKQGYINVKLSPDDDFYSMVHNRGYVKEHRLVMARKLGRPLLKYEQVHHINGIKDYNTDENLLLLSPGNHLLREKLCRNCPLRKQVKMLRKQIIGLEKQLQGGLVC